MPNTRIAWVTLDDRDADAQLWPAIAAALSAALAEDDGLARAAREWLGRDLGAATHVSFLDDLAEARVSEATPVVLVLDDVHHLSDEGQQGLLGLVHSWQDHIRLVIAGRCEPHLPLARLRLRGQLCELREDDLRFTADEGAQLLALAGLRLSHEQVEAIYARTAGWAAGLRLAARHLHRYGDPHRPPTLFSGRDDALAEYLAVEVLDELEDEERNILRRASIVDPLPADLAGELCGRDDAAEVLERLSRKTGLLSLTEDAGVAYRTQEMLRSYLATDLSRSNSRLVSMLHGQAAVWFDARDRSVEALRHASASGNTYLLHSLLGRRAVELAATGEHEILASVEHVQERPANPWLLLGRALADFGHGDTEGMTAALHQVRRVRPTPGEHALRAFRDAVEQLCGAPGRRRSDPQAFASPLLAALSSAGQAAASLDRTEIESAVELARLHGFTFLEVQGSCLLAIAHWFAGDLRRAGAQATGAVAAATAHGWGGAPWVTAVSAVLAHAQLLQGRPESALAHAYEGLQTMPSHPCLQFALRSVRGAALADIGRHATGVEELRAARIELSDKVPSPLAVAAALFEHDAALLTGYQSIASAAQRTLLEHMAPAESALAKARSHLLHGHPESAHAVIAPVLAGTCDAPVLADTLVNIWVVEANCAFSAGDRLRTRDAVRTATGYAKDLDAVRPFRQIAEGPMSYLVDIIGRDDDTASFAARALAARRPDVAAAHPDLSTREREVLVRLQAPSSLNEISIDLGVSVNTVKTHLRAIYTKLGVSSRRSAVVHAHYRGLM